MTEQREFIDGNDIEHLKNLFGTSTKQSRFSSLTQSRQSHGRLSENNNSAIGEGSNIKQWLSSNIDFSVANASKLSARGFDSALTSKVNTAVKQESKPRVSKKKEISDQVRSNVLAQLDLRQPLSSNKLAKNYQDSRKQSERLNGKFNAQQNQQLKAFSQFQVYDALKLKEMHVRPLNYHYDFKRLTQIFGR